jgi:hypothetical protein
MKIGYDGDLELKIGRPLRGKDIVPRNAKPQQRLDTDSIGRTRSAEGAESGDETKELTT